MKPFWKILERVEGHAGNLSCETVAAKKSAFDSLCTASPANYKLNPKLACLDAQLAWYHGVDIVHKTEVAGRTQPWKTLKLAQLNPIPMEKEK